MSLDLRPTQIDILFVQRDEFSFLVNFTVDGLPLDLTGGTITFRIKSRNGTVSTIAGTITDAANGQGRFTLSDSETDLATGVYTHTIRAVTATVDRTFLYGTVTVSEAI